MHNLEVMAIAASSGVVCDHDGARAFFHDGHEQFVVEVDDETFLLTQQHNCPEDAVHFAEEISAAGDQKESLISFYIAEGVFH